MRLSQCSTKKVITNWSKDHNTRKSHS